MKKSVAIAARHTVRIAIATPIPMAVELGWVFPLSMPGNIVTEDEKLPTPMLVTEGT